jgi:cysteine-rich repeat protein
MPWFHLQKNSSRPLFRLTIFMGAMFIFSAGLAAEPPAEAERQESSEEAGLPAKPKRISAPTLPFPPVVTAKFYDQWDGKDLQLSAICGDGVYDFGEDCDDGNLLNDDGCSEFCKLEHPELCGNGRSESGETCDDTNLNSGDGCSATCQDEGICGDGVQQPWEQCEDGNEADGDGCSAECLLEGPLNCGNSVVDPGETCDDGGREDGDGCGSDCQIEGECGDSVIGSHETCDDGNTADGDGCSAQCQVEETECGNGRIEAGESCDDSNVTDGDGCSAQCTRENPRCGNGIIDENEACDDGNTQDGDSCSANCREEIVENCVERMAEGRARTQYADCDAQCYLRIRVCERADGVREWTIVNQWSEIDSGDTFELNGMEYYCINGQPVPDQQNPTANENLAPPAEAECEPISDPLL